jgi:hypothetical protein
MTTTVIQAPAAVLALLYWTLVLLVSGLGVAAAVVTTTRPRRWLVVGSASALTVAIVLMAVPHPHATPLAGVVMGLAALVWSVFGGGPAVMFVLALASRDSVREGDHGGILVERTGSPNTGEVLRGGTTIGVLERIATTTSIMAGYPEAIAVVVAIKSVGRFTELDVAEARERFIIGTLVSLVWASACGALFRLALGG